MEMTARQREICERAIAVQAAATPETVVRVEGAAYTIGVGLHALIRARRDHAAGLRRGGYIPDHVRILTELRNRVAEELGVDRRTASLILRGMPRT
jgi:hypothetical protein